MFAALKQDLRILMPPNLKWFKPQEVVGLDQELCAMLDLARQKAGIPFRITSGLRTSAENKKAGGSPNSQHLNGKAVDLACKDAFDRWKMVFALKDAGFRRIEVSKDGHTHCALSEAGYPDNWFGIE